MWKKRQVKAGKEEDGGAAVATATAPFLGPVDVLTAGCHQQLRRLRLERKRLCWGCDVTAVGQGERRRADDFKIKNVTRRKSPKFLFQVRSSQFLQMGASEEPTGLSTRELKL